MGDDITIGVTEIVNNIEVTAQPNDQIVDISVIDNADDVTLNITPTVIEINVNRGSSFAKWGTILGTLSDQTDLQNALDLKANLVGGKVPASELPSYVDDVVEVANYAALPTTGETGKIYVTLDNNKIYRWSGSVYIEIAANSAIWGAITGTLSSQTDLVNALNLRVPYTGATSNVNLGEYGLTSGFLGLDTTPTSTPTGIGTIYWDSANRTAALIDGDGDTTLQIGQEQRILVHNNTGSTLTDGQVVYVTGSTGNLPSVSLANASSETTSAATLGVVTESIANGADGFITTSGIVNGLNTLAFNEGELLWLGTTAGTFTSTKPISPNHLVLIGYVIKKAGGNGSILVKIQNTQELEESSDVLFTSLANNQVLTYESATDLWKNKSIATILGYTPANDSSVVHIAGTETITGIKTFSVDTIVNGVTVGKGGASEAGNTAVGENALSSNTSGILNTAIGFESLLNNTGGGDNTSLGWWSLKSNTTGNSNVSAGTASLANNTTGFGNTSLGWNSLAVSTTGAFNSALGYLAGSSFGGSDSNANTLTSYSIYIGYKAGPLANSQTNQIVIGKNAIGAGSNTVTIGNTDITTTRLRGEIQGGSFKKDGGTSSQFLKADGSVDSTTYQTALTNPVTGTGTTNYIPKFTGASAIGNSLIYDNGTNIEIGGGIITNKSGGTFWQSKNGATNYFIIGNDSTIAGGSVSDINYYAYLGNQIFSTGGSEKMRITSGGNVGIGTTSPTHLLSVENSSSYETASFKSSSVPYQIIGNAAVGDYWRGFFTGQNIVTNATTGKPSVKVSGYTASAIAYSADSSQGYLGFFTTSSTTANTDLSERMRITSVGNVGIGTTSPLTGGGAAKWLTLEGSTYSGGIIGSVSGVAKFYNYFDNASNTAALQGASGVGVTLWSDSTERMRITSGGNVGIGTTSPGGKLHVDSANMATDTIGNVFISATNALAANIGGQLTLGGFYNGSSKYAFGGIAARKENATSGNVAGYLALMSTTSAGALTERMRITSGGRVGIGFTSPVAKLSVRGEDNTSSNFAFEAANGSGNSLFYVRNDGATFVVGTITSSGGFFNSDIRLKGLTDYDYNVSDIKPITYLWKDGRDNKKHVGYSAQEVQKVMPDAVNEGTDGMLSVNYVEILVAKISQMEKEIAYLKSKI